MLATLVDEPFRRAGWVNEEKYDGYRALAYKRGARVRLWSRNAIDRTADFAEIAGALAKLRGDFVLDGEIVAFDAEGVSRGRSRSGAAGSSGSSRRGTASSAARGVSLPTAGRRSRRRVGTGGKGS